MSAFIGPTLISAVIFFGFLVISIYKFGIQSSYSAYSTRWFEIHEDSSVWSYATMAAILFLIPPLVESGDGSTLQFLGFLSPVYLGIVALTPRWKAFKKEHIIHSLFAGLCAIASISWSIFVVHTGMHLVYSTAAIVLLGLVTKTLIKSFTFWAEMIAFVSIYVSLILIFI